MAAMVMLSQNPRLVDGGVLEDERRRTHGFTAGREALDEAAEHQQRWGPGADLAVGGQEPHQGGRASDGNQGDGQDAAAADPVAERAEEQAADGSDHESDAERGEGGQQGSDGVAAGEEQLREDHGSEAVEGEVVELDELADASTQQDALLHLGGAGASAAGVLLEGGSPGAAVVDVLMPGSAAGCWFLMSLMVMRATLGSRCFR